MAFLGQEEQLRELQDRFRILFIGIFIGLGLILSRLVYLQVLNGDKMRQYSEENRIKRVKIAAPRGMIMDRKKTILIDNHPAFDLEVIPQFLRAQGKEKSDEVIKKLTTLINITEEEIKKDLKRARGLPSFMPVKIRTDLTRDEVAVIESHKIDMPGVQIAEEIRRTNVYGDVASHLLGYIGEANTRELERLNENNNTQSYKLGDSVGKYGLEQMEESILRGVDGERLVEVDALGRTKLNKAKGRVLDAELEKPAVPGRNLILTIDQDLQQTATEAFGEQVGSLVAMDPRTGEILAMISRPSFDPTEFSRGIPYSLWKSLLSNPNRPLRDKTIQDHYPPGSTFKVVTAVAALEEGIINSNTTVNCPGFMYVGNRRYHCHKKGGHGNVNIVTALSQSCDVFFYRVSQKLKSVDDIAKWAFHLGLGKKTEINLAREVPGLIPTEAWKQKRFNVPWQGGETLSVAIGQSYLLTTTLQLANLYASIANGGTLYKPYVIRQVETVDGKIIQEQKPVVIDQHRLSPRTYELVKQGLWGVVNTPQGTTYTKRLPGMDFVGKTGTAQVIRLTADKIYQKCQNMRFQDRHHGLFAGYAPAHDPKIAVAVVVEHGCSGSGAAAPIARAVVKKYLEKYWPDLYSEKAIAERLKNEKNEGKPSRIISRATPAEPEDVVVNEDANGPRNTSVPALPVPPVPADAIPVRDEE